MDELKGTQNTLPARAEPVLLANCSILTRARRANAGKWITMDPDSHKAGKNERDQRRTFGA